MRRIFGNRVGFAVIIVLFLIADRSFSMGSPEVTSSSPEGRILIDSTSDDVLLQKGLIEIAGESQRVELVSSWAQVAEHQRAWAVDIMQQKYYPNLVISVASLNSGPLRTAANTKIAAGVPDEIIHGVGSYYIKDWVDEGILMDVTDYWNEYGLEAIIPEGVARPFRFDGRYYGFPVAVEGANFFWWNIRAFEGIDVQPPPYETWDEFFDAARRFNSQSDIPFLAMGLNPTWFAAERLLMYAAARFGLEIYERVANGEATEADWRQMLEFWKQLTEIANSDFASLENISGVQRMVASGDAATTLQGVWAYDAFASAGLIHGEDFRFGSLPKPYVFFITPTAFYVFNDSANPHAGLAVALAAMTKESIAELARFKNAVPARTDVAIPDNAPPIVSYSAEYIQQVPTAPRLFEALPPDLRETYGAPITSYLVGTLSLDRAAAELVRLQAQNQHRITIPWRF